METFSCHLHYFVFCDCGSNPPGAGIPPPMVPGVVRAARGIGAGTGVPALLRAPVRQITATAIKTATAAMMPACHGFN
jgi:hypothetical protein